jgi:hypothetical protein
MDFVDWPPSTGYDRIVEPLPPATARAELDQIVTTRTLTNAGSPLAWGALAFSMAGTWAATSSSVSSVR